MAGNSPLDNPDMHFFQSLPQYSTEFNRSVQYVIDGTVQKLSIEQMLKPKLLEFWVIGYVSMQYLNALRNYRETYAIDLQVTNDIIAKL